MLKRSSKKSGAKPDAPGKQAKRPDGQIDAIENALASLMSYIQCVSTPTPANQSGVQSASGGPVPTPVEMKDVPPRPHFWMCPKTFRVYATGLESKGTAASVVQAKQMVPKPLSVADFTIKFRRSFEESWFVKSVDKLPGAFGRRAPSTTPSSPSRHRLGKELKSGATFEGSKGAQRTPGSGSMGRESGDSDRKAKIQEMNSYYDAFTRVRRDMNLPELQQVPTPKVIADCSFALKRHDAVEQTSTQSSPISTPKPLLADAAETKKAQVGRDLSQPEQLEEKTMVLHFRGLVSAMMPRAGVYASEQFKLGRVQLPENLREQDPVEQARLDYSLKTPDFCLFAEPLQGSRLKAELEEAEASAEATVLEKDDRRRQIIWRNRVRHLLTVMEVKSAGKLEVTMPLPPPIGVPCRHPAPSLSGAPHSSPYFLFFFTIFQFLQRYCWNQEG
jgi:hypothetical protein